MRQAERREMQHAHRQELTPAKTAAGPNSSELVANHGAFGV